MLISLAATIVGGVGSLKGAVYAGMLLGLTENLSSWRLPTQWSEAAAFVVLFLFIIFRPTGFYGVAQGRSWACAYLTNIGTLICINAILAVTLNFILGYAGIFSVAHALFFGIGAYTAAWSHSARRPTPARHGARRWPRRQHFRWSWRYRRCGSG